jgi:beta-glucosidase
MNNSILEYLTKGKFNFNFPGLVREEFQDNIKNTFDFIGLNYYTRFFKRLNPFSVEKIIDIKKPSPQGFTDMNWEIYPEGLYRALKMIQSYTSKPIYITENGIADDNDFKRSKFIENHLLIMNKAISEGLNIKGYFYWSLIDNWEWAYGFEKRFGLYQVDFKTQERTLRNGSRKYPEMIKQFQQK